VFYFLALIKQNSLNKFLTGIETGKKIAFFRPFKVDLYKMVEILGESIDNKCFSNLPGPPQN